MTPGREEEENNTIKYTAAITAYVFNVDHLGATLCLLTGLKILRTACQLLRKSVHYDYYYYFQILTIM